MVPSWNSNGPLEILPVALVMVHKAQGDVREAIIGVVHFAWECNTVAGLVGEICGAPKGISTIPVDWFATINEVNPDPNLEQIAH